MSVSATNWQQPTSAMYQPSPSEERYSNEKTESTSSSEPSSTDSGSGFKMKSSAPDDSVGQLASMLARAETKMDVQQVYSKAMQALGNLKMASMASESDDAKKVAQMIKRMENLIKRIQKKLKNLSKEEQMEVQREKAQKAKEEQKEKQIREELRSRKSRRKREEREYALKEISEDNKAAANEMVSSMLGTTAQTPSLDFSSLTETSSYTSAGIAADIPAMEGISIDVAV